MLVLCCILRYFEVFLLQASEDKDLKMLDSKRPFSKDGKVWDTPMWDLHLKDSKRLKLNVLLQADDGDWIITNFTDLGAVNATWKKIAKT